MRSTQDHLVAPNGSILEMARYRRLTYRSHLDQGSGSPSAIRLSDTWMTKPLFAILLLTTTALSSPAIAATEEELDWIFDQVFSGGGTVRQSSALMRNVTPYGWERGNPFGD